MGGKKVKIIRAHNKSILTTIFNLKLLFRAQKRNSEDRPFNLTEIRERHTKKEEPKEYPQ